MFTSVIYQNDSGTTTLLDLPASIETGQCLPCNGPLRAVKRMLSTVPPEQPYVSLEPKGFKRAKLLEKIPRAEQEYHGELQALILAGLGSIESALGKRQWLLPRQTPISSREEYLQQVPRPKAAEASPEPPVVLSSISNNFSCIEDIADRVVSNPSGLCTSVVVDDQAYNIPPLSTFILSDVGRACSLATTFPNDALPKSFDVIIMDPPWQNRSVRHAKTYRTSEHRSEQTFLCVLPILRSHLRADGLVGIWVTNKASIRQLVLDSLHDEGFQIYEEWVWIKVTAYGDPVTPLDGIWRRPYEMLLLFRRGRSHPCGTANASEQAKIFSWPTGVRRRMFVAVPNYHSQKPCLKEFIEPLLTDPSDYQALEIFARNLTAGWFGWGDEVLKFNCEGHWAKADG
jgi:N6-adenosine-specific RNA methylase IME4